MALLLGPERARQVLAEHGGVIIHDDGDVEAIGPIDGRIDGNRGPGACGPFRIELPGHRSPAHA
jgi:hypothetical protein